MEAVPRLPMISFDLKVSPEPSSFGPKLKKYICDFYNDDPESYNNEIHQLESLRAMAVRPPIDVTGCSLLKKYYCQLHFLQSRFPMDNDGAAAVTFTWRDTYANMAYALSSIRFEIIAILYNIGAVHTQLGSRTERTTADGMKMACTHYQCAAWAFEHLKNSYPQPPGIDLAPELMTFMHQLCLAQAQECILEKSMLDNRKATIVAKVATQVVDYYNLALNTLEHTGSEDSSVADTVGSKIHKSWKKYVCFKKLYYLAVSQLYQGQSAEEQQKMGERVAFYNAALATLQEARTLYASSKSGGALSSSEDRECVEDALTFTNDVIEGKRKAAKNENEFIYHEEVPERDALPSIKGASLVKGIPFSVNDPEVSGNDIFSRLVPMKVHEASSLYSEEKAKILRLVGGKIEERDQHLVTYLASLRLENLSLWDPDNRDNGPLALPEELAERCAALNAKPNAIQDLVDAMGKLADTYHDVEAMLKDIKEILAHEQSREKQYQDVMGKRPPSIVATDLTREANKYQEAHAKASESNQALHRAMTLHVNNLRILAQPLSDLMAQLPTPKPRSTADSDAEKQGGAVTRELKRILGKVDEMRRQRSDLHAQLRNSIAQDDLTRLLVTATAETASLDSLFAEQLSKHNKITTLIDQNLAAQDNILSALTDVYARSAESRKAVDEVLKRRDAMIASLISSYDAYEDLLGKSSKGLEFYRKLETNVSKLLQRVKSTCNVQEEEREQILARNTKTVARSTEYPRNDEPTHGASSSGGLKLKDYLAHRQKGLGTPVVPAYQEVQQQVPRNTSSPLAPASSPYSSQPQYPANNSRYNAYSSSGPYSETSYPPGVHHNQQGYSNSTNSQSQQMQSQIQSQPIQTSYHEASQVPQPDAIGAVASQGQNTNVTQSYPDGQQTYGSYQTVYGAVYPPQNAPSPALVQSYVAGTYADPSDIIQSHTKSTINPVQSYTQSYPQYPVQNQYPNAVQYQNYPQSYPTNYESPMPTNATSSTSSLQNDNYAGYTHDTTADGYQYQNVGYQNLQPHEIAIQNTPTYANYGTPDVINSQPTNASINGVASDVALSQYPVYGNYAIPNVASSQYTSASSSTTTSESASSQYSAYGNCVAPDVVSGQYATVATTQTVPSQYSAYGTYAAPDVAVSRYTNANNGVTTSQTASSQYSQPTYQPTNYTQAYYPVQDYQQGYQTNYGASQPSSDASASLQSDSYKGHPGYVYDPMTGGYNYSSGYQNSQTSQPQVNNNIPNGGVIIQQDPAYSNYVPQDGNTRYTIAGNNSVTSHTSSSEYNPEPCQMPAYTEAYYTLPYGYQGQGNNGTESIPNQNGQTQTYMQATNNDTNTTTSSPGEKKEEPTNEPRSNVDLLADLEFSINHAPLVPEVNSINKTEVKSELTESKQKPEEIAEVTKNLEETQSTVKIEDRMENLQIVWDTWYNDVQPKNDPLGDPKALQQFAFHVERYEKFMDGLLTKTLSGATTLDIKWKEILDVREREAQKQSTKVACEHSTENRNPESIPYDASRMELLDKKTYVNASHVKDVTPSMPVAFIVAQAPIPKTSEVFWRMVWEQECEVIACLASNVQLNEEIYWPASKEEDLTLHDFTLSLESRTDHATYVERIISIKQKAKKNSRIVVHMQFTSWPINTYPSSPGPLLTFCNDTLSEQALRRSRRPIIVHCTDGGILSGLFLLAVAALCNVRAGRGPVDTALVFSTLVRFRKSLVNQESLLFAYRMVLYHAQDTLMKRGILSSSRSTFECFDGNKASKGRSKLQQRHPSEDFLHNLRTGMLRNQQDFITGGSKNAKSDGLNSTVAIDSCEKLDEAKSVDPLSQLDPMWSIRK